MKLCILYAAWTDIVFSPEAKSQPGERFSAITPILPEENNKLVEKVKETATLEDQVKALLKRMNQQSNDNERLAKNYAKSMENNQKVQVLLDEVSCFYASCGY